MPGIEHCRPVDLPKAYLLMNHGPVVLISSAYGGRQNVMTAAWAMPLDFSPAKVAVVVDRNSFTRELMEKSGEFVLSIPPRALAETVMAVGSHSGREVDKFAAFGIATAPAEQVSAPLIAGCLAWLECRIIPEPHNQQTYDLFVAEVVAAWADERVFSDGRWHFAGEERRTIHYLSGGSFVVSGRTFEVP